MAGITGNHEANNDRCVHFSCSQCMISSKLSLLLCLMLWLLTLYVITTSAMRPVSLRVWLGDGILWFSTGTGSDVDLYANPSLDLHHLVKSI